MKDKALNMLGMAARAGEVCSGEFAVEKSVKSGEAVLVLIATDGSDNTRKKFRNMCAFYDVPFVEYATKDTLGHAIGKDQRSSVSITDVGLAKAIRNNMESFQSES